MADPVNAAQTEEGSQPSGSSEGTALTPEQRDAATIARFLGNGEPDEADEEDGTSDDASGGGDGEADDSEEQAGDDSDSDEAAEDDELEVTDEEIETILDALDTRLLDHPRVKAVIEERAKADADRRAEEARRATSASQESDRLIGQGRKAAEAIYELVGKAGEQLAKAVKGEEFEQVAIDPEALKGHMIDYGAAVRLVTRREFDDGFSDAFRDAVPLGGALSPEEAEKVKKIVSTAQRIEGDPEQGTAKATSYLFSEGVKFLVERAKEAGRAEARAEIDKRRTALKKIVGDKGENATTAAMAKIAKQRKKLPPKPSESAGEDGEAASMDAYRAAKASGDREKADRILNTIAQRRAQGR